MSHQHVCGENCPWHIRPLREAHERSRLRRRAAVAAKLKGHRPKVRWTA